MEKMATPLTPPHLKFMVRTLLCLTLTFVSSLSFSAEKTTDDVSSLLCPRSIERFVETGKSTLFNMEDLVETKNQIRQTYEDLYYFMLDKQKNKGLLEEMQHLDKTITGLKTKETRAQGNYNKVALEMGSYLTKTKRCWSSIPKENKAQINMLFDYILKEKRLSLFKECVKTMDNTSVEARKQYALATSFMNKKITEKEMVSQGRISQERIKILKTKQKDVCKGMDAEKYYQDYIQLYFLNFSK